MAELLVAGQGNDEILQSLSYKLGPTSEYIQQRRQSRVHPSGASSYSSNTTQIARIELKGQGGYLDMSTLKICFRLAETGGALPLILAGGPHALISRIRVFCQGSLVEDCSHYGRVHHLFTELMAPSNWRLNHAVETNLKSHEIIATPFVKDQVWTECVEPGEYATVLFTPSALGIMNCGKLWPIELAPLTLEITFAQPNMAVSAAIDHPDGRVSSQVYVINNLHLQCSQVILDSSVNNAMKSMLASGRSLTIAVQSVFTQAHMLAQNSTSFQISMVRALSKLGMAFVSYTSLLSSKQAHQVTGFANPSARVGAGTRNFSHNELTISTQMQLDSFLYPETPMDSLGEHWSKLQEAAATYDQKLVTLSITPAMYKDNGFVCGINFMRAPGSWSSGLNTRTGSLLTLKVNDIVAQTNMVFVHLVGTILVEVRADSCSVYD